MSRFALDTTVSVARSRAEIETILARYGVVEKAFLESTGKAAIQFRHEGRVVRFVLTLPDPKDARFTRVRIGGTSDKTKPRSPEKAQEAWEQGCRQKWRALCLAIKAKLEAVESEIATFEEEFLAYIVMPNGTTVAEHVLPRIAEAYKTKSVPPLLEFDA